MNLLKLAFTCLILALNVFVPEAMRMHPPLRFKREMMSVDIKSGKLSSINLVGVIGLNVFLPRVAEAVTSSKAEEALQLLNGYQTRTDPNVTWAVLIAGSAWIMFEIYKGLANW